MRRSTSESTHVGRARITVHRDLATVVPSFFRYCQTRFARRPESGGPGDEHMQQRPSRQTIVRTTVLPNGQKHEEEVDLLTDFSWRNFFSTINFAKIMQKLSKQRSHRIRMLVQYKSSVSASVRTRLCGSRSDGLTGGMSIPGGAEADIEGAAPHAAAACPQVDQEPSSVLWQEVAPV